MKKTLLLALTLQTAMFADSFKHNEQVFTSNTMEVACAEGPKMLYFGTSEEVKKKMNEEIQHLISGDIDTTNSDIYSFLKSANFGKNGLKIGTFFGVSNFGAAYLGEKFKMMLRGAFSDPEYMYVSECNEGKNYTRLISMVVLNDKVEDLNIVKKLAIEDQNKFIK